MALGARDGSDSQLRDDWGCGEGCEVAGVLVAESGDDFDEESSRELEDDEDESAL